MDHLIATSLVAHRQHGPKRMSGASPFCLRTSTCGRAHWPFLTQNSFVWLHLFLWFSLNLAIPIPFPFAVSTFIVRCHLRLHSHAAFSFALWFCVHFMHQSLCVCSQHSYISFCLFFHHMVNVDYICLHQRKCMWKPPCPSCMLALFCSHIFTDIPWGRFAIST